MMSAESVQHHRNRNEADGPMAYADRLSSYIKDANYIQAMTRREYGERHLPTVETIRAMQAKHRQRTEFARRDVVAKDYKGTNDNGELWRPKSLIRMPKKRTYTRQTQVVERPKLDANAQLVEPMHQQILKAVADAFEMTVKEMLSGERARTRSHMIARVTAARLLRNQKWADGTDRYSLGQIANILKRKDHSTAHYTINMFGPYRRKYPEMMAAWKLLKRRGW